MAWNHLASTEEKLDILRKKIGGKKMEETTGRATEERSFSQDGQTDMQYMWHVQNRTKSQLND